MDYPRPEIWWPGYTSPRGYKLREWLHEENKLRGVLGPLVKTVNGGSITGTYSAKELEILLDEGDLDCLCFAAFPDDTDYWKFFDPLLRGWRINDYRSELNTLLETRQLIGCLDDYDGEEGKEYPRDIVFDAKKRNSDLCVLERCADDVEVTKEPVYTRTRPTKMDVRQWDVKNYHCRITSDTRRDYWGSRCLSDDRIIEIEIPGRCVVSGYRDKISHIKKFKLSLYAKQGKGRRY